MSDEIKICTSCWEEECVCDYEQYTYLDENIADPEAIMKASLDQGKNLLIETFPSVDLYPDPACDY